MDVKNYNANANLNKAQANKKSEFYRVTGNSPKTIESETLELAVASELEVEDPNESIEDLLESTQGNGEATDETKS